MVRRSREYETGGGTNSMTEYQRYCARRATMAAKGHNRRGAIAWVNRCRAIGDAIRTARQPWRIPEDIQARIE